MVNDNFDGGGIHNLNELRLEYDHIFQLIDDLIEQFTTWYKPEHEWQLSEILVINKIFSSNIKILKSDRFEDSFLPKIGLSNDVLNGLPFGSLAAKEAAESFAVACLAAAKIIDDMDDIESPIKANPQKLYASVRSSMTRQLEFLPTDGIDNKVWNFVERYYKVIYFYLSAIYKNNFQNE